MEDDRLLVRADEAARLIGVGRSTLYDLVARGELPSVRLGRSVRIPVAALRALASGRRLSGGASASGRVQKVGGM